MIAQILIGLMGFIPILGIRIIRPTEKMIVETLGKYSKTCEQGFHWIVPFIQSTIRVNVTERMVDVPPQTVITKDNLNAKVDAVVYYQINDVVKSQYNVSDHQTQLTSLARTTLRAVIGKMSFTAANEGRDSINTEVEKILDKETDSYGVKVLRVELQKIEAPEHVQEAMNEVVVAERKKMASKDFANAKEIEADGIMRATLKESEGIKQSYILKAQGESEAMIAIANAKAEQIKLENEAIRAHFKDTAIDYKRLETMQRSLSKGSKYIVGTDKPITTVLSEVAGIAPIQQKK